MTAPFELFPWFKNFNISPSTDWEHFINPQFNVTINEGDAAVENHVLSRAGSYGKQMGRMQEVMDILLERVDLGKLSPVEQRSVEKYRETRAKVLSAVAEQNFADGPENVDRWLDALAKMREADRPRFDEYARRLNDFLQRNKGRKKTGD
jgi:hypothetical protein